MQSLAGEKDQQQLFRELALFPSKRDEANGWDEINTAPLEMDALKLIRKTFLGLFCGAVVKVSCEMSVPRSLGDRRHSTRRASALIRQFMDSTPVISAGAVSSALTSRHDLIIEDDFKKVFDAVCAVDEHKQGHILPSEVAEVFRLLGCQDDPSAVKRCTLNEALNGRIDLVQVLRIFFPSCAPTTIEKLLPPWARASSNITALSKPTAAIAPSSSSSSTATLLSLLDSQRGYVTVEDLEMTCHGIDKGMLAEMAVCCSDEAAARRAADMDVFRTKRLVDLFVRAKLPPGLANVRTSPYLTLFTLGSCWSAVRAPLIAALPSLPHQTRLAALAVFVHRHGPLAAFKVSWTSDLEAPVPGYSIYVDMCTTLQLTQRPPIDPRQLRLGPQQLEKILNFAQAKECHALLGVSFASSSSASGSLSQWHQASSGGGGIVNDVKAGLALAASVGQGAASPSSLLGASSTSVNNPSGGNNDHQQQHDSEAEPNFTVRHTLKLPRPKLLVSDKSAELSFRRAVTPPCADIEESEWLAIVKANEAAALSNVDPEELNKEKCKAHKTRNETLLNRWQNEHAIPPKKRTSAELQINHILEHGVDGTVRNFLQTLDDAAKLTYCSNVRHATDDMVVVEPTAHTPRAPRRLNSATQSRPASAPKIGLTNAFEGKGRERLAATTPRIGSGLACHRPLRHPPQHALRSMWSRTKWSYDTPSHD